MALCVCLLMEAGGWVEVGVGVYLCMCAIVQQVGSLHKRATLFIENTTTACPVLDSL
jgi:hypothetical protein